MRASSKDRLEAFEEQGGWVCSRETGWVVGRGARDAGRGYVRSMSSALFRAGLEATGWVFSKQIAGPALIFVLRGSLSSVQCSYLLFSLIWFIYIFLFKI